MTPTPSHGEPILREPSILTRPTANNVVTMLNGLNLNGLDRTIFADSGTAAAYAVISGQITGTGGLIKTGPGTLALTGTNNYNGSTKISDGALQANDTAGLPSGNLILDGGMLQAAGAAPVTLSRTVGTGPNQVQWNTTGGGFSAGATTGATMTVTLAGLSWGGSGIQGTLRLNSLTAVNALTMTNALDLTAGVRTIQVDANTATITGNVTSTGAGAVLTKTGAGTLQLSGPSNGTNYGIAVSAGTLTYGALSPAVAGVQITGGTLTAGTITSTSAYDVQAGTVSAILGGVGIGLNKTGTGTAFLTGVNTYTGATSVSAGILSLGNGTTTGNVSSSSAVSIGPSGTLQINGAANSSVTIGSAITGTGTLSAISTGTTSGGTVALNAVSGFTGNLTLGSASLGTTVNLGVQNVSLNRLQMTSAVSTLNGTGTITAAAPYDMVPTTTATVNVKLAGANVPLDMRGAGTTKLMLSNSYTGSTTVFAGILQADDGVGLPTNSNLVFVGGILQSNGTMTSFTRSIGTGPGQFQFTNGGWAATGVPLTVNIGSGGAGYTVPMGGNTATDLVQNTLTLSSASATSTTTFVNGLNLGTVNRVVNVVDNTASTADWAVISGNISGNAALSKNGTGLLILTGTNTFGGTQGTVINAGVLQADDGVGMPAASVDNNGYFFLTGGQLQNNSLTTFTRNLVAPYVPNGFTWNTSATAAGFSAGQFPFTINIGSGAVVMWSPATASYGYINGTLLLNSIFSNSQLLWKNDIDLNGTNRIIQVNDNTATKADYAVMSGVISGVAALSKNGTGLLILAPTVSGVPSPNTYGGVQGTVINGGVLQADDGMGIPAGAMIYVQAAGTLQNNTAYTFTRTIGPTPVGAGNFNWAVGATLSAGPADFTINIGGASAGVICGAAAAVNTVPTTMNLNSIYSAAKLDFQNPINLSNLALTVQVIDNADTTNDYAVLSGVISSTTPASGSLVKTGGGLLVLPQTETYAGNTTISAGSLQLGTGGTTGMVGGNLLVNSTTPNARLPFALVVNRSDSFTYAGVISGAGTFKKTGGSGTVMTLTGNCTISGLTTLDSGNGLQFGNGGTTGGYTTGAILNNGTLAANRTDLMAAQSGIISGTGTVTQLGTGTWVLTGANTYSGDTTISAGYLQANSGTGLSNNSFLKIDGGVLQANGAAAVSFTRALAASGAGKFDWTANGGGFSASNTAGGAMNVNVGGALAQLLWGAAPDVGSKIVGTLKLSSATAVDVTTMLNAIDLNGTSRTVDVANNTGVTTDKAVLAGVVSNGTGTAGLVKTGLGRLDLSAINTYNGATTISTGTLALATNGQIAASSSILNSATFMVVDGTHTVNAISGTGTTMVLGTSSLTAPSISQGTLTIGGTDPGGAAAAVPEPSMLVLLVLAGLGFVGMCLRRK